MAFTVAQPAAKAQPSSGFKVVVSAGQAQKPASDNPWASLADAAMHKVVDIFDPANAMADAANSVAAIKARITGEKPPPARPASNGAAPTTGQDVKLGTGAGLLGGFAGIADTMRPAATLGNMVGNALGFNPNFRTSAARADQAGAGYEPQTRAGRYAKTVAANIPNLLAPERGGAGLAANVLRRTAQVALPAIASEGAREGASALGFGKTGQGVAKVIGGVGGGIASSVRRPAVPPSANAADAARDALHSVGIDIRVLPAEGQAQAIRLIEDGRSPIEVARTVAASHGTPVAIPLRKGDMTGNPVHQHAENMALRGAYGERPAAIMQGHVARQQDALRGNTAAFANEFAGGNARPVGQGATGAAERLSQMRDAAEQRVTTAYDEARASDGGARLPRDQGPVLAQHLREGARDVDMEGVPRVARVLARFDNRGGPVDVRDVFDARAQLNRLSQSSDTVEAAAAGMAKRALDGYIDQAMDQGLIRGDATSVNRWRQAIAARREVGRQFEGDDLIETLTERVSRGGDRRSLKVDPGEAGNIIFGRTGTGAGKPNLFRDLTRVRTALGPNSGEWNNVRAEHFQRLAKAADGAIEGGNRQFSGVKFQKAWEDFNRDDPRLAALLYTPAERARISNFANIAARVTAPVKGGDNPSNSAVSALKLLPAFLKGVPFIKNMAKGVEVQVHVNSAVRATNPTPSRLPVPRPSVNALTGVIPGIAAAGSSGASNREGR